MATVRLLVTRVTALSARLGWCASSRPGYSGYSEPGGNIDIFIRVQVFMKGPPTRRHLIVSNVTSVPFYAFFRLVELSAKQSIVVSGVYQVFLSCVVCQVCVAPPYLEKITPIKTS